jgi:1-phosphatidylinositol-4-phosphate 5-kinase
MRFTIIIIILLVLLIMTPGDVHERYDLKGNTDRRQAIPSSDVEFYMRQRLERHKISKLMMDIDFSRIHRSISCPLDTADILKAQLKKDVAFLAQHGLMDYR